MRRALRLGVVATHPIQYYSPLYRELAARPSVDLTVLYAHRPTPADQGHGFGVPFEWDIDLLGGYRHVFLRNVATSPTAAEFRGCDTPDIADEIRQRSFDAVLVMGWHARSYWQAMRACWSGRIPVLVRGDSQLAAESSIRRLMKRVTYPRFVGRFAACLAVGERSAEYFRYYGARRVVLSPHFVDNGFFADGAAALRGERAAIRRRWGIDEGAVVALFAGKLVEKKRPLDAVRGAAAARVPGLTILFVGDGALRADVEREAARLGVSARVAGFLNQSEIPRAYAAADVLVLPSDARETWGLVVNEAMAAGLPAVVSTSCGCVPDLVLEGETGFSFPCGDTAALGAVVARVASSAPLRARLGAAAARHVRRYSVDAAADGVVAGAGSARQEAA